MRSLSMKQAGCCNNAGVVVNAVALLTPNNDTNNAPLSRPPTARTRPRVE